MTLKMEKASLNGYSGKIRSGSHTLDIQASTPMTAAIARTLGVHSLVFDKKDLPKSFLKMELDNEVRSAHVRFVIRGLESYNLDMASERVHKFVVFRSGDGKKKAKHMTLKFHIQYGGSALELVNIFEKIGSGDGVMTIESVEQQTLAIQEPKVPAKTKKAKRVNGAMKLARDVAAEIEAGIQ